jgi:hypothetical protein
MEVPFEVLWANHPSRRTPKVLVPCQTADGRKSYTNQCAIRIGVCLSNAGLSMASYRGTFCWHGHGRNHPLRAEEVACWLNETAPFVGEAVIARRDSRGHQKSFHDYLGRKGIVLFRNFFGAGNQGDHIDLWDGAIMATGELDYFTRSQEVWFWELT